MRVLLAMAVAAISTTATARDTKCSVGAPDVVQVLSWEARQDDGAIVLKIELENVSGKSFRMIDATVWFRDVLGGGIGGASLTRDLRMKAGERVSETKRFIGMQRLTKAQPADVLAVACTEAVLFDDGGQARFK